MRKPLGIIAMLIFVALTAKVMASKGLAMGLMLVVLPGAIIFVNRIFNNPRFLSPDSISKAFLPP